MRQAPHDMPPFRFPPWAIAPKDVVINCLELHVAVGVFPPRNHHTAADVMEAERKPGDTVLVERANAAGLTIRYSLPRLLPLARSGS